MAWLKKQLRRMIQQCLVQIIAIIALVSCFNLKKKFGFKIMTAMNSHYRKLRKY